MPLRLGGMSQHILTAVALALRQRAPPHRARLRVRRAVRRLQPLPADGGQQGADGLGHRRTRHPDPGPGRQGRRLRPGARRPLQPGHRRRPARPSASPTTCSPARPRATTTPSPRRSSWALHHNGYIFPKTTMGAISPSTRAHAARPLHRGHLPHLRVRRRARRPVRQLRQPARPDRPDQPASRRSTARRRSSSRPSTSSSTCPPSPTRSGPGCRASRATGGPTC